ncbi:hypothetical protein L6452_33734 [Arctium lappa]|uniref:Uncharacterized protein n=1 Tax=Arctium lappa TaxID=4217 RepID=A0ACB8YHG2_ARCLA|nr:hypothetical protein L6452_33734 [Arctium lappa]
MVLVTHQAQGSYALSRPSWKRGSKPSQNLAACCTVQRMDITSCLCVEPTLIYGSKRKSLRISYRLKGSQSGKSSFKHSYISEGNEDILSGLPKVQNGRAHSTPDADVTTTGSLAIRNLFKSWLTLLPMASQNKEETLEGPSSNRRAETDHELLKGGILETVWSNFSGIDATIKIPAIIFIPLFLIVNMKYGAQVAKELTPLWIGGPLVVALYIKTVRVICSLYVFSFKKSVKVVNNFSRGKIKEVIWVHIWQHMVYFRNLDYIAESKRVWEEFQAWMADKCLDFVESVWSCRQTIGLLKMANIM